MVTKFSPETVGRKIEKLEREILLSGSEYDEAIKQCAKIAQEDYQYAELAFNKIADARKQNEEAIALSNTWLKSISLASKN